MLKLPATQSLQPQKWPSSQQTDSCQNETEPLSNTAQEKKKVVITYYTWIPSSNLCKNILFYHELAKERMQ